uniref:Ferritin n=1 Tax=Tursiops truncatus TaxID=9739 RepID=A0A6J3Q671_TURTR|nr:ferritin light chain-like [Tursiops truncatus]
MSAHILQNYSAEVEAVVNRLVNMHLRASYTYLSLGFYFHLHHVALEGVGHLLQELAEEKREVSSLSWKYKTSAAAASPSRMCRSHLKMNGVKPRTQWKPPYSWSARADFHLCDFLESRLLDGQVKLIKKMAAT